MNQADSARVAAICYPIGISPDHAVGDDTEEQDKQE
jgi:hypothetical protein